MIFQIVRKIKIFKKNYIEWHACTVYLDSDSVRLQWSPLVYVSATFKHLEMDMFGRSSLQIAQIHVAEERVLLLVSAFKICPIYRLLI